MFEKYTAVQIESEVLYISAERVEVNYVFANPTARDVTAVITFPLPDLTVRLMYFRSLSIPFLGEENFVGFSTWVDGKEIHMNRDVHVTLEDGRDVTNEIRKLGINIFTPNQAYAPTVRTELLKLGALDDGGSAGFVPRWVAKATFYSTQIFPTGKKLHIKHTYKAAPSKSFAAEAEAEWCTDDAYKAGFRKLLGKIGGPYLNEGGPYLDGEAVRYVLKTGANWAGPIGDFPLKLDKAGRVLLSTCPIPGLSLKREGNMFVARAQNYTPSTDLNILFVRAPRLKTE